MPSLYEMAKGPGLNGFEAFMGGREAVQRDRIRGFTLADLARENQVSPYWGQALQGNQGAFSKLNELDPGRAMEVGRYRTEQAKAERKVSEAEKKQIAGALLKADTAEKWRATMDYLERQGHAIDDDDRDFASREAYLGMIQGINGQREQQQFETDQSYRNSALGLQQENLALAQRKLETESRRNAYKDGVEGLRPHYGEVAGRNTILFDDMGPHLPETRNYAPQPGQGATDSFLWTPDGGLQ